MQAIDMALHETFRANLRKRRTELHLTQRDLAERLGVTNAYISEVEAGKRTPSLETVERFAKALNCGAVKLLVSDDEAIAS